jgi:two-component system, NtrC family, response regulator AtoC
VLSARGTVMIVDDERHLRESLAELFAADGYTVLTASDGDDALEALRRATVAPDAIFLDLKMPGRDGIATLKELASRPATKHIPVIVITAFGGSEPTISAMKTGAYDYITKPFDPDEVLRTAARAMTVARLQREVERLREAPSGAWDHETAGLIGQHPTMREVYKLIGKVAAADTTVLITGESGTGKEIVARAIHRHSPRASHPLVTISGAAIPDSLIESELFGHERGAFTGALQTKPGRLEQAEGGTLFLDEIGDLPAATQVKLLRVLQEREFERLGGQRTIRVNVRVIAATNRALEHLVSDGRFREDLFYRLNVVQIQMPPLRARRSDIPALAEHFVRLHGAARLNGPPTFADAALRALLLYDYPGNVRELENIVQRSVTLARGSVITLDDLTPSLSAASTDARVPCVDELVALPLDDAVRAFERLVITRALIRSGSNKTEAARLLGIRRQHLYDKMRDLHIDT